MSAFTRLVFITPKVEVIEVQPIIKPLEIVEPKLEVKIEILLLMKSFSYKLFS